MIIVEGIDGSGKTFLSKTISLLYEIPIIKFDGPPDSPKEFYRRCTRSINNLFEPSVHDRFPPISDFVYSFLENRDPYLSEDTIKKLIVNSESLVIYCCTGSIERHCIEKYDKPEYVDKLKQNWNLIQEKYRRLMSSISTLTYDLHKRNENFHLIFNSISFLLRRLPFQSE